MNESDLLSLENAFKIAERVLARQEAMFKDSDYSAEFYETEWLLARALKHMREESKLKRAAQVGNAVFTIGVSSQYVIERAQREYIYQSAPKQEAERLSKVAGFIKAVQRDVTSGSNQEVSDPSGGGTPEKPDSAQGNIKAGSDAKQVPVALPRVIVSRAAMGIYTMQVCAHKDATDAEILDIANVDNPSGTTGGWSRVCRCSEDHPDHPAAEGKTFAPVQCSEHADRLHFLLVC